MKAFRCLRAALPVALLGMVAGSCGGGGAAGSTTPPVAVPAADDAPWEVRALFGYDRVGVWDVDGEGVRFVADGARAQVEGSDVRFAAEHVFDPFECGARVGDGYVFITADGAIYSADEFLGPLTLRRPAGARVTSCLVSRRVMVVREGHNDLLFVGPEGETWRLPDALRGHVVDAAFRDLRHGIVVVPPGVALITRDNVTYAPMDLAGAVLTASPESDRWVVQTTDGWFAVSDAGEATALAGRPQPTSAPPSDALLDRVQAAAQAQQPTAFTDWLPGPDGRLLLRFSDDDYREDVPSPPVETWSPTRGFEALELPGDDCQILSWGGRAVANCPGTLYAQDATGGWRELGASDDAHVVAAGDGSTLAMLDGCDSEGGRAAQLTCERTLRVFDGEGWRSRTLDERVSLLGVHGRHVLVEARRTHELRVVSVDSASGDRTLSMPGFARLFLRFDAGGGLFGSAWGTPRDGETPTIAVYARPGESLAEVELPEGAFGFEMADGRRGVAVGDRLDEVWVTTDGAGSWERLALPGVGDVADVELPVNHRGGPSPVLQCGALACRVHYTWLWGAPAVVSTMDRASVVHVPRRGAEESEWLAWRPATPTAQPVVQCELPPSGDGAWTERVRRATGSLGLEGERLGWAFHDRGRAFEGASGDLSSAPIGADDLREGVMEPLLISARFALFDHCTQPRDSEEPDPDLECGALRVVRAGGQPEPLQLPVHADLSAHFVSAHPLPRGHHASHFVATRDDEPAYDIVAELDADGAVVRSRVLVFPPHGHVRWLAVRGAVAGLVAGGPGRAELVFHPVDGSAATSITPPASPVTRVCARASAGVSVVVHDAALGPRLQTVAEEARFYAPVLRLDGEASCLLGFQPRTAATWTDEPAETAPRWLSFELLRGALRVRAVQPEGDPSEPSACTSPTVP